MFEMLPEAFTFRDLVARSGRIKVWESVQNLPKILSEPEQQQHFRFLLPGNGNCIRQVGHSKPTSLSEVETGKMKWRENEY